MAIKALLEHTIVRKIAMFCVANEIVADFSEVLPDLVVTPCRRMDANQTVPRRGIALTYLNG